MGDRLLLAATISVSSSSTNDLITVTISVSGYNGAPFRAIVVLGTPTDIIDQKNVYLANGSNIVKFANPFSSTTTYFVSVTSQFGSNNSSGTYTSTI